jgi:hypothetical protein
MFKWRLLRKNYSPQRTQRFTEFRKNLLYFLSVLHPETPSPLAGEGGGEGDGDEKN